MKNNRVIISTAVLIALFFAPVPAYLLCKSSAHPVERISENEKVSKVRLLKGKSRVLVIKYDIEIEIRNGHKVLLHNVERSLRNKEIALWKIDDIGYHGGSCYEICETYVQEYNADDIEILGKIIGVPLNSVDDVVNNVEELYNLYCSFEMNGMKERIYKDKFVVKADFKKSM